MESLNSHRGYDRPIEVADNIYWVGFHEERSNLHCNPYLIVAGDRAVLIDGGSRPDFAVVMMKILQTGITPEQITALIYHHVDPDLCGSMSNMVDICANPELIILSEPDNNIFLSYYLEKDKRSLLRSIDDYGGEFNFGGRNLQFFKTPYAHNTGSFVTYDGQTKTVFSSDLFGSLSTHWDLFIELEDDCYVCEDYSRCIRQKKYCPLPDILAFHKNVVPSEKSLRYAMDVIGNLEVEILAPQHGSIFKKKKDINFIIKKLRTLKSVGIDSF
ncbi:MAG: MBL fold metallo-hydrolase [Syntrophales bacterium]|jgi:flavorubredoxin